MFSVSKLSFYIWFWFIVFYLLCVWFFILFLVLSARIIWPKNSNFFFSCFSTKIVCSRRLHFRVFCTEFTALDFQIIHELHTNLECERCPLRRKSHLLPKNVAVVSYIICVLRVRNEICCCCYIRSLDCFISFSFYLVLMPYCLYINTEGLSWFFIPIWMTLCARHQGIQNNVYVCGTKCHKIQTQKKYTARMKTKAKKCKEKRTEKLKRKHFD